MFPNFHAHVLATYNEGKLLHADPSKPSFYPEDSKTIIMFALTGAFCYCGIQEHRDLTWDMIRFSTMTSADIALCKSSKEFEHLIGCDKMTLTYSNGPKTEKFLLTIRHMTKL